MLNWVLQEVVLVRLVNLWAGSRIDYIVLKRIAERGLVDDEPDEDEKAEVLDPGELDCL